MWSPDIHQGQAVFFLVGEWPLGKLLAADAVAGQGNAWEPQGCPFPFSGCQATLLDPWHHLMIPTFSVTLHFLRFLLRKLLKTNEAFLSLTGPLLPQTKDSSRY